MAATLSLSRVSTFLERDFQLCSGFFVCLFLFSNNAFKIQMLYYQPQRREDRRFLNTA